MTGEAVAVVYCGSCFAPTSGPLTCSKCARRVITAARAIASVWEDLVAAVGGDTARAGSASGGGGGTGSPMPFDPHASELKNRASRMLRSLPRKWVTGVKASHLLICAAAVEASLNTAADIAEWERTRFEIFALIDPASRSVSLLGVCGDCSRPVFVYGDGLPSSYTCRGCSGVYTREKLEVLRDWWAGQMRAEPIGQAEAAAIAGGMLGRPVSRKTIGSWIRRGKLADQDGRVKLQEVIAICVARQRANQTKEDAR